MKTLLLFISFFIIAADAATVRLYFTDPLTNEKDTNAFYITPVGTNVLSNGGVVGRGVTTRYVPASNGYRTNTLAVGHYSITNRSLGSGVVIRVPESSSLYDYTNLLISGYNIFVTVTNGSSGGTSGALTNNETRAVYLVNNLTLSNNASATSLVLVDATGAAESVFNSGGGFTFSGGIIADNYQGDGSSLTGVGNVTSSGLAAGSYAINSAGITNTLEQILGANSFSIPGKAVTNITTYDFGRLITLYSTNANPGLSLNSSVISGVTLTNSSANKNLSVTLGSTFASGDSWLKDSIIHGDDYAIRLEPGSGFQTNGRTFTAENTLFKARSGGVEVWRYKSVFRDCTFDATTVSSHFAGSSQSFAANDQSTNYFTGCDFIYGANTNIIAGFVGYLESQSFFSGCRFICVTNATTNSAITLNTAVWTGEEATYATFQSCDFYLNGGLLIFSDLAERTTNNIFEFRDCYITPWTNRILATNSDFHVRVSGGNLKPSNFSHPSRVVWMNETNEVIVSTDAAINTYYTNGAKMCLLSSDVLLITGNASDTANLELRVDQANNGSFETAKTAYLAGVTDAQVFIKGLSAALMPGARYIFTNLSTGLGATADINPNSTQIVNLR